MCKHCSKNISKDVRVRVSAYRKFQLLPKVLILYLFIFNLLISHTTYKILIWRLFDQVLLLFQLYPYWPMSCSLSNFLTTNGSFHINFVLIISGHCVLYTTRNQILIKWEKWHTISINDTSTTHLVNHEHFLSFCYFSTFYHVFFFLKGISSHKVVILCKKMVTSWCAVFVYIYLFKKLN